MLNRLDLSDGNADLPVRDSKTFCEYDSSGEVENVRLTEQACLEMDRALGVDKIEGHSVCGIFDIGGANVDAMGVDTVTNYLTIGSDATKRRYPLGFFVDDGQSVSRQRVDQFKLGLLDV